MDARAKPCPLLVIDNKTIYVIKGERHGEGYKATGRDTGIRLRQSPAKRESADASSRESASSCESWHRRPHFRGHGERPSGR